MKKHLIYVFALFFILNTEGTTAQSLEDILAKHYEAVGQNARNQLRSMFLEVKEINENNEERNYSIILKKPGKIRIEGVWEGQNFINAYDGKRAWTIAPWTGVSIPQLMTLDETDDIKSKDGVNSPIYNCQQNQADIIYSGIVNVDDVPHHLINVTSIEKPFMQYYLNTESYLLNKSIRYSRRDSLIVEEVEYSNYSKQSIPGQGDINIPMTLEVRTENTKIELVITEVILGFGAPNSFFTKPD